MIKLSWKRLIGGESEQQPIALERAVNDLAQQHQQLTIRVETLEAWYRDRTRRPSVATRRIAQISFLAFALMLGVFIAGMAHVLSWSVLQIGTLSLGTLLTLIATYRANVKGMNATDTRQGVGVLVTEAALPVIGAFLVIGSTGLN